VYYYCDFGLIVYSIKRSQVLEHISIRYVMRKIVFFSINKSPGTFWSYYVHHIRSFKFAFFRTRISILTIIMRLSRNRVLPKHTNTHAYLLHNNNNKINVNTDFTFRCKPSKTIRKKKKPMRRARITKIINSLNIDSRFGTSVENAKLEVLNNRTSIVPRNVHTQ